MGSIKYDIKAILYNPHELIQPIAFTIILTSLFPLCFAGDGELLARTSSGIFVMLMVISGSNFLDDQFQADMKAGFIVQHYIQHRTLKDYLVRKLIFSYITTALPFLLLLPLICILLRFSTESTIDIILIAGISLLSICALGLLGSAIRMSSGNVGFLSLIILVPFYIPLILFSSTALEYLRLQLNINSLLLLLCSLSLFFAPISIWGANQIIKQIIKT